MSSLYLLDTNMVIYIQRGVTSVLQKLVAAGRQDVALPSLVVAELALNVTLISAGLLTLELAPSLYIAPP